MWILRIAICIMTVHFGQHWFFINCSSYFIYLFSSIQFITAHYSFNNTNCCFSWSKICNLPEFAFLNFQILSTKTVMLITKRESDIGMFFSHYYTHELSCLSKTIHSKFTIYKIQVIVCGQLCHKVVISKISSKLREMKCSNRRPSPKKWQSLRMSHMK